MRQSQAGRLSILAGTTMRMSNKYVTPAAIRPFLTGKGQSPMNNGNGHPPSCVTGARLLFHGTGASVPRTVGWVESNGTH